jgi:beta-glucanase (GH16 family)/fibronectin type 3 domain-containing protein
MKLQKLANVFPRAASPSSKKRMRAAIEALEGRVLLSITAPPIAGTWTEALNENFDSINPSIWTNSRFWWDGDSTFSGTYLPSQATISNGILSLTALNKPAVAVDGVTEPLTSGMINTGGIQGISTPGFAFTYGFIDVRMQCAPGSGIWSALWMLPVSHQDAPGELDVVENTAVAPTTYNYGYHTGDIWIQTPESFNTTAGYHDYGLDWEPGSLTWYLDGVAQRTYTGANVPAQAEYAILNLDCDNAPGWTGPTSAALPSASMNVDYIRVWQHTPNYQFGSQVTPAVNQFSDSSFENLSIGNLGTYAYTPNTFDWQYSGESGLQTNNGAFGAANAPDGVQTAFIQSLPGQTNGSIAQTLDVTSAGNYEISFDAAQRKGYGIDPISVSVDGTVVTTITPGSTAWNSYTTPTFSLGAGNHVFAFTGATETSDSDSFIDVVKLVPAPTAPTGVTVSTGHTGISLNWTASSGATSYDIYRGGSAGGESATPIATGVTATSYTDTGVLTGDTYYYYVTAVYASLAPPGNQSSRSSEVSAVGELQPPTQPANLSVTTKTSTSVSLSWTASTDNVGVAEYTIYRGTTVAGTVSGTTTTFTDTGLTPGTSFSYTVVASDAAGNKSPASTALSVTTVAAAPQFADASFEAVSVGTTYAYRPSSPYWTFANSAGVEVNGSAWKAATAPDGKQAAFLQSYQGVGGSIKQSLTFGTAGNYQISLYAAERANYGVAPIAVSVDGTIVATITPSSTAFAIYSTPVLTLTAGTHTFTFSTAVITTADTDSFIDKVSVASVAPALFSAYFDFGPTGSPVAAGYTAFSTAAYSSSVGYGWLPGADLWALDRGALAGTTALTEDFIQTDSGGATFAINVPNGVYNVTPTFGDALWAHDLQGIYLQGTQVDTITTAADQFISKTYTVTVTNGQLQFTFKDLGGADLYTTLDALAIVQIS